MSDAESRSFFATIKKFPLIKLRLEIAIIKSLFVECRRTAEKKVEVGLSSALNKITPLLWNIPSYIHTVMC